jgi:hypothetical protein
MTTFMNIQRDCFFLVKFHEQNIRKIPQGIGHLNSRILLAFRLVQIVLRRRKHFRPLKVPNFFGSTNRGPPKGFLQIALGTITPRD